MKVLISYAYAGIGHKKAALAIEDALKKCPECNVVNVDALDYTNRFFKFSYPRVYLFLINRMPWFWGLLYYLFDNNVVDKITRFIRGMFHNLEAKKFKEFVIKENFDVVICTHFLAGNAVSCLKKKNIFKGKLITVITDFLPHSFWLNDAADYYIGALEETRNDLIKRGVSEEKIRIFGIPCEEKFSLQKEKASILEKLTIKKGFFNTLIMGGGFGTGPVEEIVTSLKDEQNIQITVICGKNKSLLDKLNNLSLSNLNVFGYMNNIDEFMEVSDVLITKSGGLTVSEALSKKLPMIIIKPIPGQETKNCDVLVEYGAAVRANNVKEIVDHVKDFIENKDKILGMKKRIGILSYPDAARKIKELIVK